MIKKHSEYPAIHTPPYTHSWKPSLFASQRVLSLVSHINTRRHFFLKWYHSKTLFPHSRGRTRPQVAGRRPTSLFHFLTRPFPSLMFLFSVFSIRNSIGMNAVMHQSPSCLCLSGWTPQRELFRTAYILMCALQLLPKALSSLCFHEKLSPQSSTSLSLSSMC